MEKNMVSEKSFTSKALVIKALFAAVLCVSAYISIPLPTGAHITFLNFIVLLIALVFPWQDSLVIKMCIRDSRYTIDHSRSHKQRRYGDHKKFRI